MGLIFFSIRVLEGTPGGQGYLQLLRAYYVTFFSACFCLVLVASVTSVAIFFALDWSLWSLVLVWCFLCWGFAWFSFCFCFGRTCLLGMALCWILSSIGAGVLALFSLVSGMLELRFFDFIFCL
jgi:hypothetical protein